MPVGETEAAVRDLAAADGVALTSHTQMWLSQRGHLALPIAHPLTEVLGRIYVALGGDPVVLRAGRTTTLPNDLFHLPTRTLVEVDEHQHFTSFRATALSLYPNDLALGFDREDYLGLCGSWADRADGYRRSKEARGFGPGGRQRQRAFYDSLRDLGAVVMGHPPVLRIAAPERDADVAYGRSRERLLALRRPSGG